MGKLYLFYNSLLFWCTLYMIVRWKDDVRIGVTSPGDVSVVETYAGEWKSDKRSGYGVCERTDGVKFEGEWFNNKKNGYGITTFRDGSTQEGRRCFDFRQGTVFFFFFFFFSGTHH